MSAVVSAPPVVAGRATGGRAVRAEWTKFRSLRSTWWSLAAGVAAAFGVGVAASLQAAGSAPAVRHHGAGHVAAVSQFGVLIAQLAVLVLAVLFLSGEYGTGMIRSSMTVVPRRLPVLLAKAAVLAGVVAATATATALAAFLVGAAAWRSQGHGTAGLADPDVLTVLGGAVLYQVVISVFALSVAAIIRSTAGAVTTVIGIFFVVPSLAGAVPVLRAGAQYLPSNAGGALSRQSLVAHPLPGWSGFALLCGYTVLVGAVAGWRLLRSDV